MSLPTQTPPPVISLSARASLISAPSVWMEGEALEQLKRAAELPGCIQAVGMPDLHPGLGIPVGASLLFQGALHPRLIGSDGGCGVRLMALTRLKHSGDTLIRRVEDATHGTALPEVNPHEALEAVWHAGPRGLTQLPGIPEGLLELIAREPEEPPELAQWVSAPCISDADGGVFELGSIGGGNHFLELSRVTRVADQDAAEALGLEKGAHAVLAHSGSRGLGRLLAHRWGSKVLEDSDAIKGFLGELAGVTRFARANRLVLCWRMLHAAGAAKLERIAGVIDVTHNTVVSSGEGMQTGWLHRKGAAPAGLEQTTVVLGSRGAPSWVMQGLGNHALLCSVAHGAGRKLSRGDALAKLKPRFTRASLLRTETGGRVLCDDPTLLYEEHPECYKDMEPIVSSLEAAAMAHRVVALTPVVTVKR